MIISAIVAIDQNRAIGKDNQIPWYLPEDLKYFKKTTIGKPVIMGRKSFDSIGRPLPKRTNIVISRNPFFIASGILVFSSIEEALRLAAQENVEEVFIIGGGAIYEATQNIWDRLYITEVEVESEADVFFPAINPNEWTEISRERHLADEKNAYNYSFIVYERKDTQP
jgi:dihydrofolate reductase